MLEVLVLGGQASVGELGEPSQLADFLAVEVQRLDILPDDSIVDAGPLMLKLADPRQGLPNGSGELDWVIFFLTRTSCAKRPKEERISAPRVVGIIYFTWI